MDSSSASVASSDCKPSAKSEPLSTPVLPGPVKAAEVAAVRGMILLEVSTACAAAIGIPEEEQLKCQTCGKRG